MHLSACATMGDNPTKNQSLSSFEAVPVGSSSTILENKWGKPQVKGDYSIEGVHFTQWEYRDSNRLEAWFLIDQNKNGIVVEKGVFSHSPYPRI